MLLHENIKNQIKESMRAKDLIRLDTLRGLNALFQNELLMNKNIVNTNGLLSDEIAVSIIKRSVKQRQDSIRQFEIGKRLDLAAKEKAELAILETFLPKSATKEEIIAVAKKFIVGTIDSKSIGKITGLIMKELAGRANGNDVKEVLEELSKS